jgi:hypothetical protein
MSDTVLNIDLDGQEDSRKRNKKHERSDSPKDQQNQPSYACNMM